MKKVELMALVNGLSDTDEVDDVLRDTDFAKSILSLDNFKDLVHSDKNFRSFMDSENDKYTSKALETWKTNNLQKLIDEKVRELYPEQDPKDIELQKLKQEMENMKLQTEREKLRTMALKTANEKKLPSDLIDYFIGNDETSTLENLGKLESIMTEHLESQVKDRLKEGSYTPPNETDIPNGNSYASLVENAGNMSAEQVAEQFSKLK